MSQSDVAIVGMDENVKTACAGEHYAPLDADEERAVMERARTGSAVKKAVVATRAAGGVPQRDGSWLRGRGRL